MAYLWNSALDTGNEKIDGQHRKLFDTLNSIASAFQENRGPQEISSTLVFLTEYTIMHFSEEEELMKKYNYPEYSTHKFSHDDFKITVGKLMKDMEAKGPSEDLIVNVTAVIGDWLITHIKFDDKKMIAYIASKGMVKIQ